MEDTLQPPTEFYRFAGMFGADGFEGVNDQVEAIQHTLGSLNDQARRVLKQFLTELLDKNPSEPELQKLWSDANHFYYIVSRNGNDGVRTFLGTVRDQID